MDMERRSHDPLGFLLGPLTGGTEDNHNHNQYALRVSAHNHDHNHYALRVSLPIIMTAIGMLYASFYSQP